MDSLLKHSINVDSEDEYAHRALQFAAAVGHEEIVKYLLEKGANVSLDYRYPAEELLWWGNEEPKRSYC